MFSALLAPPSVTTSHQHHLHSPLTVVERFVPEVVTEDQELIDESTVRYNEVQWKAAHNSVERSETIFEQIEFMDGNCGAIELDFIIDPKSVNVLGTEGEHAKMSEEEIEKYNGWRFSVQHHLRYRENAAIMTDVFSGLKKWSIEHPDHTVLTVHLDMKQAHVGTDTDFVKQIDEAVVWGLGRDRLFTPGDLMKDACNLVEGAKKYGWPTLQELKNKFIIVITGADAMPGGLSSHVRKRRQIYASTEPQNRMCFVDIDQRACSHHAGLNNDDFDNPYYKDQTDRVFLNIQLGNHDWEKLGKETYKSGWMISRLWKANNERDWIAARKAKIHLIATNQIRNHPWASISRKNRFAVIE